MQQNESQKVYQIPQEHWRTIQSRDPQLLQKLCIPGSTNEEWLTIRLLNREVRINPHEERIEELIEENGNDLWKPASVLTAQAAIFYLVQGEQVCMSGNWLPEHQLKCGSFFRGIHQLPVGPLLERFDHKPQEFTYRIEQLDGRAVKEMGDAAVQIWLLDQVPIKLILWCSDDELPASLTVLFDSSIEQILAADAIWALFQLLGERMLEEE